MVMGPCAIGHVVLNLNSFGMSYALDLILIRLTNLLLQIIFIFEEFFHSRIYEGKKTMLSIVI